MQTYDFVGVDEYSTPFDYFVNIGDANQKWYLPKIKKYAEDYNLKSVCELGVYQGASMSAWISGGVNIFYGYDCQNCLSPSVLDQLKIKCQIEMTYVDDVINVSKPCPKVDAIFFDATNTYDYVKQQMKIHAESANKLLFVNATNYPTEKIRELYTTENDSFFEVFYVLQKPKPNLKKVYHAVDEFLNENNHWKLIESDHSFVGLAILERSQ